MIILNFLFFNLISIEQLSKIGYPYFFGLKHLFLFAIIFIISIHSKISFRKSNLVLLGLFFSYALFQLFINKINATSFVVSFIFTSLPLIAIILGNSISISNEISSKLLKYFVFVGCISVLPAFVLLILGYDIRLNSYMYREAGALGSASIALFAYLYYMRTGLVISKKSYVMLSVILIMIIFGSLLKKNMLMFFFFLFLLNYFAGTKFTKALFIIAILGLIPIGPALLDNIQDNIDYTNNVGFENHIRLGMYLTALRINLDYAFIGSGLGTFGSLGSLIDSVGLSSGIKYQLSQIYLDYGISNIAGNSAYKLNQGEAGTLLDTFWPHIFGELGVLGALLYILIILNNLSFKGRNWILAFIIIAIYFDGLFLIIPESPLFILLSIFLPSLIMKNPVYFEGSISKNYSRLRD